MLSAGVDRRHAERQTAAWLAEHVAERHQGVVERELAAGGRAQRHVRDVMHAEPRLGRVDKQPGHPLVGAILVYQPDEQDAEVAAEGVGDVELAPVNHVAVGGAPGGGPQRARVRARVRFGQPEPAEPAPGEQRLEEALGLLGTGGRTKHAGHHALYVDGGPQRPPAAAGLLHQDRLHHHRQLVSPGRLRHAAADVAEVVQLGQQLPGERAGLLVRRHKRRHLLVEKGSHRVTQCALVLVQQRRHESPTNRFDTFS